MNEWEKAQKGYLYDANYDENILKMRSKCVDLCYEFNMCKPSETEKQTRIMKSILGEIKGSFVINAPFRCDYGMNISIGKNFFSNYNCIILDGASVKFGDNVFIAPNCIFTTSGHPIDREQRNAGLEIALPISIGNDVWIGANVAVLPGVTIGDNCVIGAGSVVNRDIPSNVVAAGNPCRVIRQITEKDREKYPVWVEN